MYDWHEWNGDRATNELEFERKRQRNNKKKKTDCVQLYKNTHSYSIVVWKRSDE